MQTTLTKRFVVPAITTTALLAAAAAAAILLSFTGAQAAPAATTPVPASAVTPAARKSMVDRAALAQLTGTYASSGAEDWGRGTFGTREFNFKDGQWALKFTLALDPQMRNKVFEFRTHGHYFIGAASKTVPGAFDALFTEDAKYVTLHGRDPQLVAAFGLAECKLTAGSETDISRDGCALWKPVAVCREDHDLLALDERGGVRFGVRPADNNMCSAAKRPTALLPAVLKR